MLNKSQIAAYLVAMFGMLNSLRAVVFLERWIPGLQSAVAALESKALAEEQALAAGLPESFTPQQLVDLMLTLAASWLPQYASLIGSIKIILDLLLAFVPLPTPPVVTP